MPWLVLLAALCAFAVPEAALAQPRSGPAILPFGTDAAADRTASWIEELSARGDAAVAGPGELLSRLARQSSGVAPERVRGLVEVEALLLEARKAAAALREPEALSLIARAARLAEEHTDVPGAAAWIAEVQVVLAITAAQAGMAGLAEVALTRAATLDPSRGIRAAEAPPALVARAARIGRVVATGATGSFVVDADVPGARVFLDDTPLGEVPTSVRAPVGTHVLRVQADGHAPWGQLIDLFEGQRSPVRVQLAPTPATAAGRGLVAAARSGQLEGVVAALERLQRIGPAWRTWLVQAASGREGRALALACGPGGCGPVVMLTRGRGGVVPAEAPVQPPSVAGRALARQLERLEHARLDRSGDPPPPRSPPRWWKRWYVWAGAGLALLAGATAAVVAARPDPEEQEDLVVVFGDAVDSNL